MPSMLPAGAPLQGSPNRDQRAYERGKRAGYQEGFLRAADLIRSHASRAFLAKQDELAIGLRGLAEHLEAEAKKQDEE